MSVCDSGPPGVSVIVGASGIVDPDAQTRSSPGADEAAITVMVTALAPRGTPAAPATEIDRLLLAGSRCPPMKLATRVGVTASKADVATDALACGATGEGQKIAVDSTATTTDNTRLFIRGRLVGGRQIRSARRRAVTESEGW